ncbi:MAG: serine/threonine-protein kinase [Gemmatimonadetes bacterium]|nr:serine/threonine-protein kinase [Gemmatimonadota bacterium]
MPTLETLHAALSGRYAIVREVGAGGMATVYLARDVKHDRHVALKVLRPELGAVLGVERFLSEIKLTANLQHPHLLPLFDSGEADGHLFYVMPYVEGESLRVRLDREHQLPVDEALRIAYAVASALDYAHSAGVVHRDLKPENILLQHGEPMISDFGIALAVSNAGGARITQTGLSLGTPQYMSPEQATGDRGVDARSDIYSLAAVLYEMLAGEPPHHGKTAQSVIARVLTEKASSVRLVRDTVPPHVDEALLKALAKLPADRFGTAGEFAAALKSPTSFSGATGGTSGAEATTAADAGQVRKSPAARATSALPWLVAATAIAVAGVFWVRGRSQGSATTFRYEIPLPGGATLAGGQTDPVAISPGGRFLAYTVVSSDGIQKLYLRASDDLRPREVPGSAGAFSPFFSPDGQWIAFFGGGQLEKVPVSGGNPVVIAPAGTANVATWSPSGWIVMGSPEVGTALYRVPETGGTPVPFTRVDSARGEVTQASPVALPDGDHVLYISFGMGGASTAHLGIASLKDGTSTVFDLLGSFPLGVLNDHLIYTTAGGAVMAAPLDLAKGRITGAPLALTDQVAVAATTALSYSQLSSDGSLVYLSGAPQRQMVLIGADGVARPIGEPGAYAWPRFSPDGHRIAVSVGTLAHRDVWIYELPSGPFTPFTDKGETNDRPEWTPDGKNVVFRSSRNGQRNAIWMKPLDGSAPATRVYGRSDSRIDEGVVSPDGRYLLLQRDSTGNGEVWYRALEDDTTLVHVEGDDNNGAFGARFSPDGHWIAYTGGVTAPSRILIRRFPSLSGRLQISTNGGNTPVWAPDGKRIYYTSNSQLMVADLSGSDPPRVTDRRVVLARGYTFDAVHADYDIGPDGMLLALQAPSQEASVVVVLNLAAELKARFSGTPR